MAKPVPDEAVGRWLRVQDATELMLSAVVLHELRYGIEVMVPGKKREALEIWMEHQVLSGFRERILAVDAAVADLSGRMLAAAKQVGHTAEVNDTLIAATAKVHGLALVTLNRRDFEWLGVKMVAF